MKPLLPIFDEFHSRFTAEYEELYKHLHAHPELSNLEVETSALVSSHLARHNGLEVYTGIGGHGVVGMFKNGHGPTVLLRADMDALPIKENTNHTYRSTVIQNVDGVTKDVMHACGHDMHVTCLLAATQILVSRAKDLWKGTLIVVFQPAEERGTGAWAVINNNLWSTLPKPDYLFGQHVVANLPAGTIGLRSGTIMAGAQSMIYRIHGRGGHASQPHRSIDPVVLSANCVVRLQQIVSREISPNDTAVVTAVPLSSGIAENVIPDNIDIGIDIRFIKDETRNRLRKSVHRIITAECQASNSPQQPDCKTTRQFPLTVNDENMTQQVGMSFTKHFKDMFDPNIAVSTIAEDFPNLSQGQPYVFWHLGCSDPTRFDLDGRHDVNLPPVPMNHTSGFAPLIQPTMKVGIEALVVATMTGFTHSTINHL